MTDAEWIESFESKQGMGACIVEGQEIAAVVRALESARRTVSWQEAVAKVVPPDVYPGYGWHAEALIDWEKIGAGTLLYAYPIPATFEQKCTVSTPNTAKKSAKGLATLLFGGDDSEEATAPIPATELKDAEQ